MATTFPRIPSFLSIPYHDKVYFYNRQRYHHWYQNSSRRCFTVYFASSVKTPRVRKKVKSNEELRSEIMEFVSVYGFPEGHVPSMKDLSEKGRIDLANIVRRRGYKFIAELLSSSNIADADELFPEKIIDEEQNANGVCAENTLSGQNKGADTLQEEFSSTEVSSTENSFPTLHEYLKSDNNGCKGEDTRNTLINETNEVKSNISHISSGEEDVGIFSSLNQDVDDLVKDTSLLTNDFEFENYTSPDLKFRSHTETAEESSSTSTGLATSDAISDHDHQINDMAANLSECPDDSRSLESDNENTMQVGNVTSNGSLIASKEHSHVTPATIQRDDNLRTGSFDFGRASHPETVTENQVEINRLKLLLHQKELELSRLKDQIEKEKGFDRDGKLRAICGGGRYDRLLSTFGGDDLPACGFGFGDAVIIELLKEKGLLPEVGEEVENIVCALDKDLQGAAATVATILRRKGQSVDLVLESKPLKWVFKRAARINASRLVLVGKTEWQKGSVSVKFLSSGEQYEIKLDDLE